MRKKKSDKKERIKPKSSDKFQDLGTQRVLVGS